MPHVLLLRSPDTPPTALTPPAGAAGAGAGAEGDKYESAFKAIGYKPLSIPVLQTVYTNAAALEKIIRDGPGGDAGLDGVVITSKRSCEAWGRALDAVAGWAADEEAKARAREGHARGGTTTTTVGEDIRDGLANLIKQWTSVPFYVVGEGTTTALHRAFSVPSSSSSSTSSSPSHCPTVPGLDIRGQDSGNASTLGPFILSDLFSSSSSSQSTSPKLNRKPRLLYLTGDKNRDTLPSILTSSSNGSVDLLEIQVYATQGSARFEKDLEQALARLRLREGWTEAAVEARLGTGVGAGVRVGANASLNANVKGKQKEGEKEKEKDEAGREKEKEKWWIVYFAPSTAKFVNPILEKHFVLRRGGRRRGRGSGADEDDEDGSGSSPMPGPSPNTTPASSAITAGTTTESTTTTPTPTATTTKTKPKVSRTTSTTSSRTKFPAYIAAIGPTTDSALRADEDEDGLGLHVDVVAAKPNPGMVVRAIQVFDSQAQPRTQDDR